MNLEDYIKNLDPELQEKARACGSVEELLALAKEAKVPLPDEALEAIAGGDDQDVGKCGYTTCPKCKSTNVGCRTEYYHGAYTYNYTCRDCGYQWTGHRYI